MIQRHALLRVTQLATDICQALAAGQHRGGAKHGDVIVLQSNLHDRTTAANIASALDRMLEQEWAERTKDPDFVLPGETQRTQPGDPARQFNPPRVR
jgi:hypothetical protein